MADFHSLTADISNEPNSLKKFLPNRGKKRIIMGCGDTNMIRQLLVYNGHVNGGNPR